MKVAVVGAGLGGLAAAARLANEGYEVEVYEKGAHPGGRCGRLDLGGFTFDTGPTILLMPHILEETFAALGRQVSDYLTLTRCDPNYRIDFADGSDVTFTPNLVEMARELERLEPGSFGRYLRFLALGRTQYHASLERFVGRNFDRVTDLLTPANLRALYQTRSHRKLYPVVSRFFRDERLRAAMTFQTMYLGLSPYESPALYGLLPFTELAVGIWFPQGGLSAIPRALEAVCRELGVTFHYRADVARIEAADGRARGLRLRGGQQVAADLVLCNADLPWAYENLIDPKDSTLPRADKLRYTSSGYLMYLGLDRRYLQLLHHNVYLGDDYRGSFEDIFRRHRLPKDLSFYVNVPARTDPTMAPPGKDGLYVLVPVPHRHPSIDWAVEGPRVRARVLARLAAEGLPDVERHIEVERAFTPDDYATTLNLARGSAFGLAQSFFQVGPFRPKNQDPNLSNLFFVGASTQPGTGVPTVMVSARLAVERILAHSPVSGDRPRGRASTQEAA